MKNYSLNHKILSLAAGVGVSIALFPSVAFCLPSADLDWVNSYYALTDPDTYNAELSYTWSRPSEHSDAFFPEDAQNISGDIGYEHAFSKTLAASLEFSQSSAFTSPTTQLNGKKLYAQLHQSALEIGLLYHPAEALILSTSVTPSYNSDWNHEFNRHDVYTGAEVGAAYFFSKQFDLHTSVVAYQDFGTQYAALVGVDLTSASKRYYLTIDAPSYYRAGMKFKNDSQLYLSYGEDTTMFHLARNDALAKAELNSSSNRIALGYECSLTQLLTLFIEGGLTTDRNDKVKLVGGSQESKYMHNIPDVNVGIGFTF